MTDVNKPKIVGSQYAPNGQQIAITTTASVGDLIYTATSSPDEWDEVTIEVANISNSTDYSISLQWGDTGAVGSLTLQVTKLTSKTVVSQRMLRGGLNVRAYCLNAGATGAGAAGVLNVYVKVLRYQEERPT